MVSDPDDIGTVKLVGWLMMVSSTSSCCSMTEGTFQKDITEGEGG